MENPHSLLKRQIKRYFGGMDSVPKELQEFIEAVNIAYFQYDDDHRMIEWSLELSSKELLEANSALQDTLAHINAIIDNIADGLLVTDKEGKITRVNPGYVAMFGYAITDLVGKYYKDVCHPEIKELVEKSMEDKERVLTSEVKLIENRIGKAVASAIHKNSSSKCIGFVILITDITREKEIDRMKTDFISTVSHELRTPLTSVLGFARIIKKKFDGVLLPQINAGDRKIQKTIEQVEENINIILSEGERLTALINDVLDIAKMEAGKIEWKDEPLALGEIIERATAATASLFEIRGLTLVKDIEEGLPEITGDQDRLIQVVINLISNAVKFTEKGSVTCRARMTGKEITVSVLDTGVGIAAENLEKVFERFRQVGDTLTDKPKGTGLGLAICKQIVEHHGGRIWVESQPGEGSNFSFTIPVSPQPAAIAINTMDINALVEQLQEHARVVPAVHPASKKSIMVADDDDSIRKLLRQELEAAGYVVAEAKDGMEAISRVKEVKPGLVVLDVLMPGMNGFDVAAVLKNDPVTMNIPIVILSVTEDRERGYRIGVDRYLTKPVNPEELLKEVEVLVSRGGSRKKVLVVDEDESTVRTLVEVLRARGYVVEGAFNGEESIVKALKEKPDMIIVDALLSEREGITKTLKLEKGLENIVYVLLAGKPGQDN